jgi:hypothetical protein
MARHSWTGLVLAQALSGVFAAPSGSANPILTVSTADWAAFNASIDGRLFDGRPTGLPCYTRYQNTTVLIENANVNQAECAKVKTDTDISKNIISRFGSYYNPTFSQCMATNEHCAISVEFPDGVTDQVCYQGTVPDYYVDALKVEHVQKALKFARKHKLPVTVKNTGHDYKGRSTGPSTFAIWVRHMYHDPIYHDQFTPEGCSASIGLSATLSAAQTSMGLYEQLRGTGYLIPGGACATTGVSGGWLAGGGHSILTPTMGMGVDNVQEIYAVLPNGEYVVANRCQNQDIFFALRGGSGGTFGVVVGTVYRLYKDQPILHTLITMNITTNNQRRLTEILVENSPRWIDEGFGGVLAVDTALTFSMVNPKLTIDQAKKSLKPLVDFLQSIATKQNPLKNVIEILPNQYAAQTTKDLTDLLLLEEGVSLTRSSRLVPRSTFSTKQGRAAIVDIAVRRAWSVLFVAPTTYKVPKSDQPGGPGYAAINPVWRDTIWHFFYTVIWDPADPSKINPEALTEAFTDMTTAMDPMRALTPNGGAYGSEADVYEPNHIDSFWGRANYNRLLAIKKKLDPDNLLSCWQCVGWNPNDPRFGCYPEVRTEASFPQV